MSSKGNPKIPQLIKKEYFFWKARMRMFLKSQDSDFISVIDEGPIIPEKLVLATVINGEQIPEHLEPKEASERTKEEKGLFEKDSKALNILFSGIDNEMLNIVMSFATAKEVWDTIRIFCEGTQDVKENRLQILTAEYESFDSKSSESLSDLYERFKRLLNDLRLFGKIYNNQDMNNNFLRALPRGWNNKVTAIEEAKDLKVLSLESLYGNLQTYEMRVNQKNQKSSEGKMKSLALAAKKKEVLHEETAVLSEDEDVDEDEFFLEEDHVKVEADQCPEDDISKIQKETMAFVARRFANYQARGRWRNSLNWRKPAQLSANTANQNVTCYNFKEPGHFASQCWKPKTSRPFTAVHESTAPVTASSSSLQA